MKNNFEAFRLLSPLTEQERQEAYTYLNATITDYPTGSVIRNESSEEHALLCILNGKANVYSKREGKKVLLNTLESGDIFGAVSLFGSYAQCPTSVVAKGTVRCAIVKQEDLERVFLRFPAVAVSYIAFLSDRIRFLNRKIDALSARSVESKVANFLLTMHGKCALHSKINMSQAASSLDIGRASLYRLLQSFASKGLIRVDGGIITLLNMKEIERISQKP